eukprot:scaffold1289_cov121-Skeletonema_marinoi.AAC.1
MLLFDGEHSHTTPPNSVNDGTAVAQTFRRIQLRLSYFVSKRKIDGFALVMGDGRHKYKQDANELPATRSLATQYRHSDA